MKLTQTLFIAAAIITAVSTSAQTTFSFHNGLTSGGATIGTGSIFDDAAGSIQDTQGIFTLTAEAFLDGVSSDTDLNGAGSGFGINATGTGDETQRFDNDLGIESMVFSFDIGGTFQSIDLRYVATALNEAVLIFDGGNTYELNNTTALSGADDFNIGEAFTAGQSITLQISAFAAAGENFSLESFTIVPEQSTFALLAGSIALAFVIMRRRHANS